VKRVKWTVLKLKLTRKNSKNKKKGGEKNKIISLRKKRLLDLMSYKGKLNYFLKVCQKKLKSASKTKL
jgi:hypothetical protein